MPFETFLLGSGLSIPFAPPAVRTPHTAYQKNLAKYRDPLTPPQTKTECISTTNPPWPGGPVFCDGWKTYWRYMDVELNLYVRTIDPADIQGVVEGCLREAAVAGLLSALVAALISGGTAAAAAAKAAFLASLFDCLNRHLADITVDLIPSPGWTDWQ